MLLERLVRAPRKADKYFTRLFIYLTILYITFLMSFSSTRWIVSSKRINNEGNNVTSQNQGLWIYCKSTLESECCAYINKILRSNNQNIPAFLDATRTFMVFGLVTQTCCLLFLLCKIFGSGVVGTYDKRVVRFLCSTTGICLFLAISIYGGRYKLSNWTAHYSLHWPFGFGIMSFVLVVGAFLIDFCTDIKKISAAFQGMHVSRAKHSDT